MRREVIYIIYIFQILIFIPDPQQFGVYGLYTQVIGKYIYIYGHLNYTYCAMMMMMMVVVSKVQIPKHGFNTFDFEIYYRFEILMLVYIYQLPGIFYICMIHAGDRIYKVPRCSVDASRPLIHKKAFSWLYIIIIIIILLLILLSKLYRGACWKQFSTAQRWETFDRVKCTCMCACGCVHVCVFILYLHNSN